jgi:formylglycine-generating enzyme required for sulfatase activity
MKLRLPRGPLAALVVSLLLTAHPSPAADASLRVDLGGGVHLDLVLVKAGTFRQGSPATEAGRGDDENARDVTISRDFYIGKVPVTRGQFARFVTETGYRTEAEKGTSGGSGFDGQALVQRKEFNWKNPGFPQDDEHPVVIVTYDDAQAFTEWLSRKAGHAAALPTEAQWEMACRAGSKARFYQGASDDEARTIGWFKQNAGNGTRAVGQKKPNALGLLDMSGNVNECVLDWYAPSYGEAAVTDPLESRSTLSDKPRRVLRGGSWLRDVRNGRCAARYRNTPGSRNADNGFRVVASVDARPVAAAVPQKAASAGAAAEPPGEGWSGPGGAWGVLAVLACPVVMLAGLVWAAVMIVRRLTGGGAPGVRTHIGDDGFWIYSPDNARGRPISYSALVDGVEQPGTIAAPGSQGEYVYTGARPSSVKVLGMASALAAGASPLVGQSETDAERRRREREAERERERRDRDSFRGYPSAY